MSAKNFMSYGDAETVLTGFANAIKNIKDGSELDSFGDVEVALLDKADTSDLGTAAAKDSTNSVTAGSTDLVESGAVKDAIDAAVSSAYHHAGTKTCAELLPALLIAANEGNVYEMTDSGTTTSDFMEGIGHPIKAGDNVGIAKISDGVYKFDLLSGFVDTSNFVQKSETSGLLKNDGTVDTTIQGDVSTLKSGLTELNSNIDSLDGRFGNQSYVRLGHGVGDNANPITVELSETYMNYDMVCFLISYYDNGVACYGYVGIPSTIFKHFLSTDSGTPMYYHHNNDNTGCVRIRKVDDTHITFNPQGFSIGGNRCVVYGVKFNTEVTN